MNPAAPNLSPATPARILIVDDEEIVLVALRDTLVREGYQVTTFASPLQALEILRKETFSVILTDQQMPLLTGLEFLAQVKQLQPEATRILITAVLSLDTVIDAINKGEIYRFIVKPWLRGELLVTVKNAVQRCELLRHNAQLQADTLAMNEKLQQLNQSLADQLAHIARQNEQLAALNQALERNLRHSAALCLHTMETFYPALGQQARRVYELCKAMAEILDLPPDQRQILEISAWLHDIGLVGAPRALIKRWQENPEGLSPDERRIIEHHPILGQELARFGNNLEAVGRTIRSHHERFDGKGYPDKLTGADIPLLARLLAVAVAYTESPYDAATTAEVINRASGAAFDPEAVRVFQRALPKAAVPRKEREVNLSELRPGMVLAKGIYTASGLMLVPEGQQLNQAYIDNLLFHNRLSPISQALFVYC